MEGDFSIDKHGYLPDIIEALKIEDSNIHTNIYREHEKLKELQKNKIETILMETTFTYHDKIYDIANFFVGIYKTTGWKPKYIINTMDYGLNGLWYICSKFDIEVFRIEDANDILNFDFALIKIDPNEVEKIKTSMKFKWFDEIFVEQ